MNIQEQNTFQETLTCQEKISWSSSRGEMVKLHVTYPSLAGNGD